MQIVIDIPKSAYEKIVKTMRHENSNNPAFYFESIIANGTPIPDNATNGDVIMTLFPNEHDFETDFDEHWWNAPYQKGGK